MCSRNVSIDDGGVCSSNVVSAQMRGNEECEQIRTTKQNSYKKNARENTEEYLFIAFIELSTHLPCIFGKAVYFCVVYTTGPALSQPYPLNLDHTLDKLIDLILTVTEVTALDVVVVLLAPSTGRGV